MCVASRLSSEGRFAATVRPFSRPSEFARKRPCGGTIDCQERFIRALSKGGSNRRLSRARKVTIHRPPRPLFRKLQGARYY
jgi:hypothetical protein